MPNEPTSVIVRWQNNLLVYGDGDLRCLEPQDGTFQWRADESVGLSDSFVADDLIVGNLVSGHRCFAISPLRQLWSYPDVLSVPMSTEGQHLVRMLKGVDCLTLRTGEVRWQRTEADVGTPRVMTPCMWNGRFIGGLGDYITALDLGSGETLWRTDRGSFNWLPYQGRAYNLSTSGRYLIQDLTNGEVLFERELGAFLPARPKLKKKGLTVGIEKGKTGPRWRDPLLAVSETHTFVANGSGQIVVLERNTGEIVQVAEIPGMPRGEPIIYENHLLLTDFNAAVHCFQGTN